MPFTQEERLLHVAEAQRRLGSEIPWLCDTIDNDVKHALGDAPNSEFILDPDGNVVVRRLWSRPEETRADLKRLVGPVEDPTTVADIDVGFTPPPPGAPRGLVPRIQTPSGLIPLRIEPIAGDDKQPFYAKLRAEADANVLNGKPGKLYLGFHMDPLHHVHWNNLAEPLRFQLKLNPGDSAKPDQGEGPKVEHPADLDPREFLLDVEKQSGKPIRLSVDYFACSDEEGWCKPVHQEYVIHFDRDRDGGNARRGGSRSRPGGLVGRPNGFPGGFRPGGFGPPGSRGPDARGGNQANRAGGLGRDRLMVQVVQYDAEDGTLTVRDRTRQQTRFQVTETTQVRRGRRERLERRALEELERGDSIMLLLGPEPDGDQPRPLRGVMLR